MNTVNLACKHHYYYIKKILKMFSEEKSKKKYLRNLTEAVFQNAFS